MHQDFLDLLCAFIDGNVRFLITIGDTALEAPSEREIARQERMQREG
jgi:hypothetical protein